MSNSGINLNEDVEGIDSEAAGGWGDYPLDAVFVRTEPRNVGDVVNRINNERYIMDPDFQREFVWAVEQQSKLIESCVMRIPLPVFYVAEAQDGRIIIVDGLQRLTSFVRYLGNHFRLRGLADKDEIRGSHALEGKFFKELPLALQERISDTTLTMYILDAKAPERAKLDIFERVNSGVALTRQQMRNALYNGPATVWLRDAVKGQPFISATGASLNPKTMRDREAVNRFCAFKLLGYENYKKSDMDDFMASGLVKLADLSEDQRGSLRDEFDLSMRLNERLFGKHAFRKSLADRSAYADRSVINISLFEVCSVALSQLESDATKNNADEIYNIIADLLEDHDFIRSITYSTNSTASVTRRFCMMEEALQGF